MAIVYMIKTSDNLQFLSCLERCEIFEFGQGHGQVMGIKIAWSEVC